MDKRKWNLEKAAKTTRNQLARKFRSWEFSDVRYWMLDEYQCGGLEFTVTAGTTSKVIRQEWHPEVSAEEFNHRDGVAWLEAWALESERDT